jgi:hypothetical protein
MSAEKIDKIWTSVWLVDFYSTQGYRSSKTNYSYMRLLKKLALLMARTKTLIYDMCTHSQAAQFETLYKHMHKKKNHLQTLTRMNRVLIQIWLDN